MTALTFDNQIGLGALGNVSTPTAYVVSWDSSLIEQYTSHSASISSSIDKVLSFLLSQDITIEEYANVESFLTNNYGVVAYLYEVSDRIEEYFGQVDLEIGVFSDPDDIEGKPELYLEVTTSLSPEEANEKLSEINRMWLFASEDQDLISLNITLKFL